MPKDNPSVGRRFFRVLLETLSAPRIVISKRWGIYFVSISLLSSIATGVFAGYTQSATAQANETINFQARILQASGALVPDGNYHIEFKIYTAPTVDGGETPDQGACTVNGGSADEDCLWVETRTTGNLVRVVNGYVSVYLGDVTAFPSNMPWSNNLYITMRVGGTSGPTWDTEMINPTTGRMKLSAVPFAYQSANVASANTNSGSTNSNNISIQTGNASGATSNSGNITIDSGTATGTAGTLLFGTNNTSGITLGRSGITTTLQGSVSLTGSGTALTVTNNAQIDGNTTLGSDSSDTLTVNANATFNGNLTVTAGDTFTNAGATVFTAISLGNDTDGGVLGGNAASTVDIATTINIGQTSASQTFTLAAPTSTTAGRIVYINNTGSASLTLEGNPIAAGESASYIWNGSAWVQTISFTSTGVDTIGALDGGTPNANGAYISGTTIYFQSASVTQPGLVSTTTQTFNGVKTFDDGIVIAAGQSLTLTGGNTASRPGSPTEGMLYFDTETDSLLVYANGKWQSDRGEYIIVAANDSTQAEKDSADYVADGTADQTEINAALTAAAGGKVILLAGTYTIDDSIIMQSETMLVGSGLGTVIKLEDTHDNNIDMIVAGGSDGSETHDMVIADLKIDGNLANQNSGSVRGIEVTYVGFDSGDSSLNGLTVNRVNFVDMSAGISAGWVSYNSVYTNNTFRDVAYAIFLYQQYNTTVSNNVINGGGVGIEIDNSSSRDNVVNGNVVNLAAGDKAIDFAGTGAVSNNVIKSPSGYGITIFTPSSNAGALVTGNYIEGSGQDGIYVVAGNNINISSNTIINSGGSGNYNGITIDAFNTTTNTLITNNRITDNTGTGYAISIGGATTSNTYLADNYYSGTGANSIQDLGTGTVYASQLTAARALRMDSTTIRTTANSILTGSIDPINSSTVTGVGTLFTTEVEVGDQILVSGETRTVIAIASDTSLTVDANFSNNGNDTSVDRIRAALAVRNSSGTLMSTLSGTGQFTLTNTANSTSAFQIQNAARENVFRVDTANNAVQIGAGGIGESASLTINGGNNDATLTLDGGTGSGDDVYVEFITGTNRIGTFNGGGDLQIQNNGNTVATFTNTTGALQLRNYSNSATAFDVKASGGTSVFTVDTSSAGVTVTGTAAVSGNLTVDTSTLFVNATDNFVSVGSTSDLGARFQVVGANDETQLLVRANGTQSMANPLVLLQNSSGAELARINATTSSLFFGNAAGGSSAAGANNTGIGASALGAVSTGTANTTLGSGALASVSVNSGNTAVGYNAGNLTTGSANIFLGYQAGDNVTTGSNNIIIGYDLNASASGVSNELRIGGVLQGDTSTLAAQFNGTLGIISLGTADTSTYLCRNSSNIISGCTVAPLSSSLTDNITDAFDLQEGTNNYININTTNSSENISFGNATTNPSYNFLGSGTLSVAGAQTIGGNLTVDTNTLFVDATNDKVGIGTTTTTGTGKLVISGSANDALYGATAVINGTLTSATNTQAGLTVNATISPTGAADISQTGVLAIATSNSSNLNAGTNSAIYGFNGAGVYSGTSTIRSVGGGTVAYGNTGSGTILHGRGLFVADGQNVGGGSITNGVGIIVQNQTAATNNVNLLLRTGLTMPTGNWNIYSDSTYDSALAGNLRIGGTTAPTVALDVTGAALISTTLGVTGNTTLTGDLAVNGGDLTTSATTFNLLATNATTVNAFGAATTLTVGQNSTATTLNGVTNFSRSANGLGVVNIQNTDLGGYSNINFMDDSGTAGTDVKLFLGYANSSAGLFPGASYIGTRNSADLILATSDTERLRISSAGAITVTSASTFNGNVTVGDAVTDNLTVTAAIQGTNALVFDGSTDDTNETTFVITNPTADNTITFPNASGTVQLAPASGSYIMQVPTSTAANTITPTAASVVGLTVNGTSSTAATALAVSQPGAAAGITVASANNTATNGLSFSGTFTNLISSTNFTVTNAGAVTAVGVNSGTGLLQGTGGLTVTGTAQINASGAGATTIGNTSGGAVSIQSGSTLGVGNGAAAQTISVGNTTGATALNLRVGTGNFTLDGVAGSTYTLGASTTTGTITIGGTAQTGNLTLGSSSGTNSVLIGNGAGATTVNIANATTDGAVNIGSAMTTGTISIGGTGAQTGTISLGTGTGVQTINLGTGGTGAKTVALGSTASTSSTTINAGSGNIVFNASRAEFSEVTGTRTLSVQTRTTNVAGTNLTVQAGQGGSTSVGGNLTIQGGSGGATSGNGGDVLIVGGTATSGNKGLVVIDTATYQTATTQNSADSVAGSTTAITAANINSFGALRLNATGTSQIFTLGDPANSTAGRVIYVTNVGSNDFTLSVNGGGSGNTITLKPNTTATMYWNGSDWTAAGASSSTDLQAAYNNTATSAGGAELVLNAAGGAADGLTVRNNATTPIIGGLLEVQTSIGSNLFTVNNNATEYASNGGAETQGASAATFPSNTWDTTTGGTVSRYTTTGSYVATGQASVSTVTSAQNHGARNRLSTTLTSGLTYTVSFAVRGTTNFSNLQVLYSPDGTTSGTTTCSTATDPVTTSFTVTTGQWTRISCTFVASGTITSSNSILIRYTGVSNFPTFYVDNLSVNVNASSTYAADGSVDAALGTNWTAFGTLDSLTLETNEIYDTSGSVAVNTPNNTDRGVRNNLSITPAVNTQYLVTFYAKSTNAFNDIRVRYSRDGGTNFVSCVDYNTQAVSASSFTKITCLFTTDGTTATNADLIIDQPTASDRTFYIDALTITLNTNNSNNVQIGGGNKGGPATLFTLDRSAGAPIAANNDAYLGSMYYDTTSGRIQCYEADGWGACGAAPDNIVNLNPEYAGSVLNGDGVGTMTADFCSNDSALSINDTLCDTGEAKNYYRWTSPQATQQTYSIYITYQLPATFNDFASDDTVQLTARTDSTTNAAVTYEMFRSTGTAVTQCGVGETTVVTNADEWQTVGINGNEATGGSGCAFAASDFVIFKLNLKANSNASAYVSTLSFTTTGR